jgi:hypothetical protein
MLERVEITIVSVDEDEKCLKNGNVWKFKRKKRLCLLEPSINFGLGRAL